MKLQILTKGDDLLLVCVLRLRNSNLKANQLLGCYSSKEKALTALHKYIDDLVDEEAWADFKDCYLSKSSVFFDIGFKLEILALDQRCIYSVDDGQQRYKKVIIFISDSGKYFKEVEL